MSRSPAKSGKAIATKSLKEKWMSIVQSARENGENGTGGPSTITHGYTTWVPTRVKACPLMTGKGILKCGERRNCVRKLWS